MNGLGGGGSSPPNDFKPKWCCGLNRKNGECFLGLSPPHLKSCPCLATSLDISAKCNSDFVMMKYDCCEADEISLKVLKEL